ncbi:MAG: hypothetical protein QOE83_1517 [Actinomycetota bacterium]|nr:hypothetical protein [Actinomycetota bacterium]
MSLTSRGRAVVSVVVVVLLLAGGLTAWALSGHAPNVIGQIVGRESSPPPPPPCPLTGVAPAGGKAVPQRPVVAVKVENTTDAYPLVGLQNADIMYEELVEGGLTRFMAVYQCSEAAKVGPVRSARTTDPKILVPYNTHPVLGYSGAQLAVVNALKHAGVLAYDETNGAAAFTRAPAPRVIPHNLFVSVPKLYARAGKAATQQGPPKPAFTYGPKVINPSRKVSSAIIPFSTGVSGDWKWNAVTKTWVRQLNGTPMMLEAGGPIQVTNVVVQEVVVTKSNLHDVLGNYSPEVALTGTGRAWIMRNGRMVTGTWTRGGQKSVTIFKTKKGVRIPLAPGTTFVELMPNGMTPTFSK